jgi:glutaredoxin
MTHPKLKRSSGPAAAVGNSMDWGSCCWWLLWVTLTITLTQGAVSATGPALGPLATGATSVPMPTVEVFVREGCQHCADAKVFLSDVSRDRPSVSIVYRDVELDPDAVETLIAHSRRLGRTPAVPTFVIGEQVVVGFVSAKISGPGLLELIDAVSTRTIDDPARPQPDAPGLAQAKRFGLPLFSLAMGTLDGVNACAMWALLFLLSMLVHLDDRRRIALLAGTFVAATVAIHALLLSAWFSVANLVRLSSKLQAMMGLLGVVIGVVNVKDFFLPGRGPSLSVPANARRGIGSRLRSLIGLRSATAGVFAVLALAAVVNVVELLCTAGFPAMYAAVLVQLAPEGAVASGYMALYMLGYALPSAVLASATVVLLSSARLGTDAGRWLKLLSGVSILVLAASLLWPIAVRIY